MFFIRNETRIGGTYRKVFYREYEDPGFKHKKTRSYEEVHLAMLGPTIRGEVGDLIKVHFMNKATKNYNMYTHGAYYNSGTDL